MKALALALLVALAIASSSHVWAHGDQPHPKCKEGYVLNGSHKCVKKDRSDKSAINRAITVNLLGTIAPPFLVPPCLAFVPDCRDE